MLYELLLINISRDLSGHSSSFQDSIGHYLIAAYLRKHDFKAYVFSGRVEDCKQVIRSEVENHKVPIIGFYVAADNIRIVSHAIIWVKKVFPYVVTVVGGPQVMALDYEFFEKTGNDFAIMGEGEIPVKRLLEYLIDNSFALENIPSLIRRDDKKRCIIVNQSLNSVIEDLDTIPYPSLEDSVSKKFRDGNTVGIITGRGCPYRCTFCYEGANAKNVRLRSIPNVMEEIDYIRNHNKRLKYINIYDDTFTLKRERVLEFCSEISKRGIKWFCEGHVSFVLKNPDVLQEMVNSGLTCIQFGIESGSNDVLKAYNKNTTFDMIADTIEICKKTGIHGITGNFIIGGALESRNSIEESKRLAKELIFSAKGIIELYVVYFAPYPNTEIVNNPDKFNMKINKAFQDYNLNTMRSPVVETGELSTKEIYESKREFESYVESLYKEAALHSSKEDILQGLFQDGKRIHLNPTWEKHYLSHPHIVNFIEHLSDCEQKFHSKHYIIRTFEDIILEGEELFTEVGNFKGIEKDILVNASGIYNSEEMARIFGISIEEIEEVYYRLNNKCLVYMSEF